MKVIAGVTFVNEGKIKVLNRRWRKLNRPTDILSFPLNDFTPGADGVIRLGDIVICKTQAQIKGHSIEFLLKHGLLHLLGVHHQ
jgi:probable rRNA maturation factor